MESSGRQGRNENKSGTSKMTFAMALIASICLLPQHNCHAFSAPSHDRRSAVRIPQSSFANDQRRWSTGVFGVPTASPQLTLEAVANGSFDGYANANADGNDASANKDADDEQQQRQRNDRLQKAKLASNLLDRRNSRSSSSSSSAKRSPRTRSSSAKATSVGDRRIGSATRARSSTAKTTRLSDALRGAATATASPESSAAPDATSSDTSNDTSQVETEINNNSHDNNDGQESDEVAVHKTTAAATTSVIQSTVLGMLDEACRNVSFGAFGSVMSPSKAAYQTDALAQGKEDDATIIAAEIDHADSTKKQSAKSRIRVRMASSADDVDIANLRLSVFSDCTPEMRQTFCARSCQVLTARRRRGAKCVVATIPRPNAQGTPRSDIILGTAECSFHEFYGTKLGRQRLPGSLLYITEVAVNPTARRKGIGAKLMQSFDRLANLQSVETIFLHVDVTNTAAVRMYEKAGYQAIQIADPTYCEFTKSLNLHNGATKGRNHFLMYKNLRQPVWLNEFDPTKIRTTDAQPQLVHS